MQASPLVSLSPSYPPTNLSEIAARVVEEFMAANETTDFEFYNDKGEKDENQVNEADDEEFEFAFVTEGSNQFSPISADEIFYNGQIRPIFNRALSLTDVEVSPPPKSIRASLRRLFIEDREITSEADELEGVPHGTYCMWRPRLTEETKSNSTGSISKRWKLRDFLNRSNSEGKDTFVFLKTNREDEDALR